MRKFRATTLQDGSSVPWVFEIPPIPTAIPVWGVNIVPQAIYASYDENYNGQGEPLYYEWDALLAPEVALPDWITEVTASSEVLPEITPAE